MCVLLCGKDVNALSQSRLAELVGSGTVRVKTNPGNRRKMMRLIEGQLRKALGFGEAGR